MGGILPMATVLLVDDCDWRGPDPLTAYIE